ncbi:aldehyde dehydrogenase family protein [soil metagenome]
MYSVQNLINGVWEPAADGATISRENPAVLSEIIATSPASDASDVERAVAAAHTASVAWGNTPLEERIAIIRKALDLLTERADELAVADVLESGKIRYDCDGEIARALSATKYQLVIAPELLASKRELSTGMNVLIEHAPVGVAALITPWNFPVSAVVRKSVPALVAGNTVVLKPSELTPVTAQIVGQAFMDAGIPAGVYNIVYGTGAAVGQPLVDHPDIGAISFTGSARVGLSLSEAVAARDVKIQVEMGGKNPLVVLKDADISAAVDAAVMASFTAAGQWCISTSRVIVEEPVYEEFKALFTERASTIVVGDGMDPASTMGPVSSKAHFEKVLSYLGPDKLSGTVLIGGGAAQSGGYYVQPTIVDQPARDSAIVQEEVFGPVVTLLTATDLDDAIELSNSTQYGLCAAIYTNDEASALKYARSVEAGRVGVNTPTSIGDETVPGGGRKNSGRGEYEGADAGILFFSHLKPIFLNL